MVNVVTGSPGLPVTTQAPHSTPPPEQTEHVPEAGALPPLPEIRWERNARGGWEAWHNPPGATKRAERTYLGYLSSTKLHGLTVSDLQNWVATKRTEKHITYNPL